MVQVGTILWAKNRPGDHGDHLHVEPPTRKSGTPPLSNPGMTTGVRAIYDALEAEFGPGYYSADPKPAGAGWSHMGWYNRRRIAGSASWSQHAYANALDIGPYIGIKAQQRFYDFLTGTSITGDDMASRAQQTLVHFFYNLNPEAFTGDPNVWLGLDENHADWADFDAAASQAGQKLFLALPGHPHGASTTVDQTARDAAAAAKTAADRANTDLAEIKSVIG